MKLSEIVNATLRVLDISQEELAHLSDTSTGYISKLKTDQASDSNEALKRVLWESGWIRTEVEYEAYMNSREGGKE